jgi:hypothetical protein
LMLLDVSMARPVQGPTRQQHQVTYVSLPCGPVVLAGRHTSRPSSSGLTQTWLQFGPGMGRAGHVGPVASHGWGGRWRRAGPVGRVRMHADTMRRPARDALRENTFSLVFY